MEGDEIRALRRLQREQGPSSHVFMSELAPDRFKNFWGVAETRRQAH